MLDFRNLYIFISPQMVGNKQYEKKNKNKQK